MPWSVVEFGKHRGKTLPQIVLSDPDYFFWAIGDNVFKNKDPLLAREAREIDSKARRIKIPNNDAGKFAAEYLVHHATGTFLRLEIVRAKSSVGKYSFLRKNVIDLSVPRLLADYDKLGCKILIRSIKPILFENKSLTRKRCEDFFDDPDNFAPLSSG